MGLPPSRKVTVPVGLTVPGDTVAVNVTAWPTNEGFADDVKVVVASALTTLMMAVEALPVIETAVPAPLSKVPVMLLVAFIWLPVATAVTRSEKEHDPDPASPNPERLIMLPPACAVTVA